MARGPGADLSNVDYGQRTDTSFRVISWYDGERDIVITRIDVKNGSDQYNSAFLSSPPFEYKDGYKISVMDGLVTPSSGIIDCFNVKVSKVDLIRAFTEIIGDLEANTKTTGHLKAYK